MGERRVVGYGWAENAGKVSWERVAIHYPRRNTAKLMKKITLFVWDLEFIGAARGGDGGGDREGKEGVVAGR
jgi:hypothetical protein